MSNEKKSNFLIKNKLKIQEIREESVYENVMEKLGLGSGNSKPSFQHKELKEKNFDKIDHTKSEHTMGLQVSKYIKIETEIERLAKMAKIL